MAAPKTIEAEDVTQQVLLHFWRRVNKNGPFVHVDLGRCWEWTGRFNQKGYGCAYPTNGKKYRAHRLSWAISRGRTPEEACVLHKCDNRRCVNPDHLFLGTNLDNINDMVSKGRRRVVQSKLSKEQVRAIRDKNASGRSMNSLAKEFGVGHSSIRHIVRRLAWKHVD